MEEINVCVMKPSRRRFFQAQWVDPVTGRVKTKSTCCTNRTDALLVAGQIIQRLNNDRLWYQLDVVWTPKHHLKFLQVKGPVVYFIEATELNRVKIGRTENIKARYTDLKVSSPCRLTVEALLKGDKAVEHTLHEKFQECRLHGEWFDKAPELQHFISEVKKRWPRNVEYRK